MIFSIGKVWSFLDNIRTNSSAPFFRLHESPDKLMLNRLIALWLIFLPSLFAYGFRPFILALSGTAGAVSIEALWQFFSKKPQTVSDLSAVATGLCCACMLPASSPVWLPLIAGFFAVAAAKLAFGGFGRSPFNPAAVGVCFACMLRFADLSVTNTLTFTDAQKKIWELLPKHLFLFTQPGKSLPIFADCEPSTIFGSLDVTSQLRAGIDPQLDFGDFLLGTYPGFIGGFFPIIMIVAAGWLIIRRSLAWRASLGFICSVAIMSLLWRYDHIFLAMCPIYDVFASSTLFVAVFLIGDTFTAPKMRSGQVIYGVIAGILSLTLRRIGAFGSSDIFAVIIMNVTAAPIDNLVWFCRSRGISYTAAKRSAINRIKEKFSKEDEDDVIAV